MTPYFLTKLPKKADLVFENLAQCYYLLILKVRFGEINIKRVVGT
jgi:hypothetical protein